MDWDTLSFHGKWDRHKLAAIVQKIHALIQIYGVNDIAINVPDVFPTSDGYNELIGALNIMIEQHGKRVTYYTLSELKEQCDPSGSGSKQLVAAYIMARHPDLVYQKNAQTTALLPQHFRLIESVCAARMLAAKLACR